ncbi:uncharacterized protein DEA37_0001749 [Paragonimus westermani]|uniref:Nucleolar protein 12 n=1 Tax=Paragonimus westermani TaxID=34504 RepID=A0A5J4P0E6_9TREM|nr:uncharacterized protein DEA37_0001749 [Paragonimus westermani]
MKKLKAAKLSLVFDEERRKEYLTGFRKRKLERRAKARKAAEARLAEEIKAVKMKYRKTARERLAALSLPMFADGSLDVVKSRERQADVLVNSTDKKSIDLPKMSLKAALKMNPTKNRRRFTLKSKRKRSRK